MILGGGVFGAKFDKITKNNGILEYLNKNNI